MCLFHNFLCKYTSFLFLIVNSRNFSSHASSFIQYYHRLYNNPRCNCTYTYTYSLSLSLQCRVCISHFIHFIPATRSDQSAPIQLYNFWAFCEYLERNLHDKHRSFVMDQYFAKVKRNCQLSCSRYCIFLLVSFEKNRKIYTVHMMRNIYCGPCMYDQFVRLIASYRAV